ncbi:hypothetical protein [uncultured Polaribacter sp.]|uniref:hypothetical protein n=1 Tax=uncultured Polaribacter sp. TaxID=174711 RepID=UPI00263432E5|nr:hypothetical protein [uncultured Polaribacter sp.]
MFKDERNIRFYIKVEDLILFKTLMRENNIPIKNEIETFTNTNSLVFYALEQDFLKIDIVCVKNNIEIIDNITPYFTTNFNFRKLPKSILVILKIILFIIILFFMLQ